MPEEYDNSTKRLIRDTATRLFREKSFDEVTLKDICKASGVNKHTFYYYYKSKDDLLKHFYSMPWQLTSSETTALLTSDNYVEQIRLIINKFIDYFKDTSVPIMRQILIKNLTENIGTFRVSDEMREMFKLETSIIEKGQKCGQFRNKSDPKVLTILIQQVLSSNGFMWTVLNGEFESRIVIHFFIENLLDVDEPYRKTSQNDLKDLSTLFHGKGHCENQNKFLSFRM